MEIIGALLIFIGIYFAETSGGDLASIVAGVLLAAYGAYIMTHPPTPRT